jgi:hypothetical protein
VPAATAAGLRKAEDAVAMGVAPVADAMPGPLRAAVVGGSGQAFMKGVHAASLVTGPLCLAGCLAKAVLAAAGIRRSPTPD